MLSVCDDVSSYQYNVGVWYFCLYTSRYCSYPQYEGHIYVPLEKFTQTKIIFFSIELGEMLISNGPIRLWRNGFTLSTYTSGQVQLVYNRQWGNICGGTIFGTTEATVICHQLGYTGASSWALGSL